MRRLLWFPIIHTQADLGSLSGPVREMHVARLGASGWEQQQRLVRDLWQRIRARVDSLELDCSSVSLYQDALPVCGRELEIVRDLAAAGSLNHQLLLDLVARGARLMGTEAPDLLVEEYNLATQSLARTPSEGPGVSAAIRRLSADLLQRRDRFIARRIEETLAPGETGLLFLGRLHSLGGLPADVEVIRLDCLTPPADDGPARPADWSRLRRPRP